jgi:hypothetical protein
MKIRVFTLDLFDTNATRAQTIYRVADWVFLDIFVQSLIRKGVRE